MKKRKLKVKKSVSRRFKVTPTGKILHRRAFRNHLRRRKTKSSIRLMGKPVNVTGSVKKKISKLLGVR